METEIDEVLKKVVETVGPLQSKLKKSYFLKNNWNEEPQLRVQQLLKEGILLHRPCSGLSGLELSLVEVERGLEVLLAGLYILIQI